MAKRDSDGIEGTGFNIGEQVTIDHCGEPETKGYVENVCRKGTDEKSPIDQVDVRIDHPGHKEHGRVVRLHKNDVKKVGKAASAE